MSTLFALEEKKAPYVVYPLDALKQKVDVWALKLRVAPRIVRVRAMRRKWGSCSTKGVITLAIDLCDMEADFQDFVIVHELLHLRYPNHGRMFKALLSAYVPNWGELDILR